MFMGYYLRKFQLLFTVFVTLCILSLLTWQYYHQGVPSHHVLQRKDLPEISNWWGAILLPALTWILLGKIKKRTGRLLPQMEKTNEDKKILVRFIIGLLLGITLAISFTNNFKILLDNVLYIFLVLGFIIPLFSSEFILAFILGMVYTFGAILPTAFVLVMAVIGLLLFKVIRPLLLKLLRTFKK
jgi:hypothetical protein